MARQATSSEKYFRVYEATWWERRKRDWWVFR